MNRKLIFYSSHVSPWEKKTLFGGRSAREVLCEGGVRGVQGLFVCTPHPLHTQSGLYCILQIYTQDVGLECFPGKKRVFFLVSVCFHEQEWLRLTNKPLFPHSQMLTEGPSSDLQPAQRSTRFNALKTVKNNKILLVIFSNKLITCGCTFRKAVGIHGQNGKASVHAQNICTAVCLKSCTREGLIYICTRTLKVNGKKHCRPAFELMFHLDMNTVNVRIRAQEDGLVCCDDDALPSGKSDSLNISCNSSIPDLLKKNILNFCINFSCTLWPFSEQWKIFIEFTNNPL